MIRLPNRWRWVIVGSCLAGNLFAGGLDQWTQRNPAAKEVFPDTLTAFTSGGGKFAGVGYYGPAIYSPDGRAWGHANNGLGPYLTAPHLAGVAYGNGGFVAIGQYGAILTSPDGNHWTKQTSGTGVSLRSVAYGNNAFVAIGNSGVVVTSPDGTNWAPQVSGTTAELNLVAYGAGTFVAVGAKGIVLTSPDAVTWTTQSAKASASLVAIAYSNGQFVGVGSPGIVQTSVDGTSWAYQKSGSSSHLLGVAYGNGLWVAAGANGTVLTSPDGTNWTSQTSGTGVDLRGVAYGAGVFVAAESPNTILVSADTLNWTELGANGLRTDFAAVIHGEDKFVAVGSRGSIVISADGAAWAPQSSGTTNSLLGVAAGDGIYVAVGASGTLLTSADGQSWAIQSVPTTNNLNAVTYGDGKFVAVGSAGTALTSADASNWTAQPLGIANALNAVVYGDGQFVTVGGDGVILTSPHGDQWTLERTSSGETLYGVGYGAGEFVAVGGPGRTLLRSAGGVGWLPNVVGSGGPIYGVAFHEGTFIATAFNTVVFSTNAVQWALVWFGPDPLNPVQITGVAFGNHTFVAVGKGAYIIQSDLIPDTPAIVRQPVEQTVNAGDNVRFDVEASGQAPLAYQWLRDGQPIAGATNDFLELDAVRVDQAGSYSVIVTDIGGGSPSDSAALVVIPPALPVVSVSASDPDSSQSPSIPGSFVVTRNGDAEQPLIVGYSVGGTAAAGVDYRNLDGSVTIPTGACAATITIELLGTQSPADVRTVELILSNDPNYQVGPASTARIVIWGDGATAQWAQRNPAPMAPILRGVAYGNGTFVAVGEKGVILTSADGSEWAAQSSGTTAGLNAVVFGNGLFVAAGHGNILSSPDGATWTTRLSIAPFGAFAAVAFGNGMFVAVEPGTFPSLQPGFYVSPDGLSWRGVSGSVSSAIQLYGVTYGDGIFLAMGYTAGSSRGFLTSIDGRVWTQVSGNVQDVTTVAYGKEVFIGVSGDRILTSYEGTNWTVRAAGVAGTLQNAACLNDTFVAVGRSGTVVVSNDGLDWAAVRSPTLATLYGVAYGNGVFVAVGAGAIVSSRDVLTWAASRDWGPADDFDGIAAAGGTYVAVGSGVRSSTDGVHWTLRDASDGLTGVAVGHDRFVAVGINGQILNSLDATNWTRANSGTGTQFYGVTYGDGTFIAVGYNSSDGVAISSTDGVDWASNNIAPVKGSTHSVVHIFPPFLRADPLGVVSRSRGEERRMCSRSLEFAPLEAPKCIRAAISLDALKLLHG